MSFLSTVQSYLHPHYYQHIEEVEQHALQEHKELIFKEPDEKERKELNDKMRQWKYIWGGTTEYDQTKLGVVISTVLTVALPIIALLAAAKITAVVAVATLIAYVFTYQHHLEVAEIDQKIADEMVLKARLLRHERLIIDLYSTVKHAFEPYNCASPEESVHQEVINTVYETRMKACRHVMDNTLPFSGFLNVALEEPDKFLKFVFEFYSHKNIYDARDWMSIRKFCDLEIKGIDNQLIKDEFEKVLKEKRLWVQR